MCKELKCVYSPKTQQKHNNVCVSVHKALVRPTRITTHTHEVWQQLKWEHILVCEKILSHMHAHTSVWSGQVSPGHWWLLALPSSSWFFASWSPNTQSWHFVPSSPSLHTQLISQSHVWNFHFILNDKSLWSVHYLLKMVPVHVCFLTA